MRVIREGNLYQLIFLPGFFPVNCYLVEEDDSLTLIDAALPYSAKKILQAAKKINKPITRILLTHAHDDHVGALDKLKLLLPNVPVHISDRDARLMGGDTTLDPNEPNTPIRGGVPKNLETRADVLLQDGDQIGSLIAIAAPGHTPGSMAFFDTRNNTLIAGDAFQTRGGMAVTGQFQPLFPFPAMATWNKEVALHSAHKLLDYKPSLLAVGHGKMIIQPEKAINNAITKARLNLKHI
ncbi:MBL fold metallo-hydrolase [Priestia megaterium]|uniref:MBL fold metallo-hydrolase n=1 Tax=Priestia megaterium TaxID=1404 RepID=UPI0030029766